MRIHERLLSKQDQPVRERFDGHEFVRIHISQGEPTAVERDFDNGFFDVVPAPFVDPDIKNAYMCGILIESRIEPRAVERGERFEDGKQFTVSLRIKFRIVDPQFAVRPELGTPVTAVGQFYGLERPFGRENAPVGRCGRRFG